MIEPTASPRSADAPADENFLAKTTTQIVPGGPVVFFDGLCGLCNRFVDFVLSRDRAGIFRFAPLQGDTAREYLNPADVLDLTTVVLLDEAGAHRKSEAVSRILQRMGGFWTFAGKLLRIVPRPLRDAGYSLVARNRYTIFGKKETCRLPTPAERSRFLS
jgi:predicted DCC family thiol-disulfide oxidoreductase YuxK